MNEPLENWKKSKGVCESWSLSGIRPYEMSKMLSEGHIRFLRRSNIDPNLPPDLRAWRACSAFEGLVGHNPTGYTYPEGEILLLRRLSPASPDKAFFFPAILLKVPGSIAERVGAVLLEEEFVLPVPFHLCAMALRWAGQHVSEQDERLKEMGHSEAVEWMPRIGDWRRGRFRICQMSNKFIRCFFGEKTVVDRPDLFATKFKLATFHSLSPTEVALSHFIYENTGVRLLIPPPYRQEDLREANSPFIDPWVASWPSLDKQVDEWIDISGWLLMEEQSQEFIRLIHESKASENKTNE